MASVFILGQAFCFGRRPTIGTECTWSPAEAHVGGQVFMSFDVDSTAQPAEVCDASVEGEFTKKTAVNKTDDPCAARAKLGG